MRSNTQNTKSNRMMRAAKRAAKAAMKTAVISLRKVAGLLTLGIGVKQWTAMLMICTMLSWSVFALPVRAALLANDLNAGNAAASGIGIVNESLPFWQQAWVDMNAKTEEWLTPWRGINANYKNNVIDNPMLKDKTLAGNTSPKEVLEKRAKTDEVKLNRNTPKSTIAKNSAASLSLKTKSMLVTEVLPEEPDRPILPDTQVEKLVSPTNNLGSPAGQTEASSNSAPAALSGIRERAGIGNFNFGLPLASLPGRGISASVGLSYNSQLWTKSADSSGDVFTYNVDGNWLAPGFQIGFGYLDDYNAYGQLPYQLILTGIDGARHQLTRINAANGYATYDSNDGSFMRGDALYNSSNIVTDLSVTYTDGTKVTYGQPNVQSRRFPVKITDIHGNFITINYLTNDQVGKISSIKDTLGRDIVFHYDSSTEQKLISVTVPGYDGSATPRQTIRFYYENLTLQTTGRFNGTVNAPASESVLKYVYFPGTKTGYRYDYSSHFGMIHKITQLQGMAVSTSDPDQMGTVTEGSYLESATTQYNYPGTGGRVIGPTTSKLPQYDKRTDDWIGRDTSAPAPQTTYYKNEQIDGTTGIGTRTMSVTSPNGSINVSVSKINPGAWDDGLTTEVYTTSSGRSVPWSRTVINWDPEASVSTGRRNPRVQKIVQYNEVNQAKATTFTFDDYNNQTSAREFDFSATGEETTELRQTVTTYETGGNYIYNRLVHLPTSVKTIVNNIFVSRIDYKYDETPLTDRANIIQYDTAYNPNLASTYDCHCHTVCANDEFVAGGSGRCVGSRERVCQTCNTYDSSHNYRGNITKIILFVDPNNNNDPDASTTAFKYDIAGNKTEAILNCCNLKTWTYDATNNAYAYPISETKGTDIQLTTSVTYDANTGLVKTSTDENNQVTSYEYESDTLRIKKAVYPNNAYTQTEYSDKLVATSPQLSPEFVKTTTTLDTNKTIQSYNYYDARGAAIRSATQTPDGWSISATEYDSIGRSKKSFNPFYGATSTESVPSSVKSTEVTNYDGAGRATQVKLQDDTFVNTYYNESAVSYTAPDNLTKIGTATRVQDQANKEKRQIVDALGRVIRVDEPDTASNTLGSVAAPNQPTHYFYDGNDNLSKIIQADGGTTQERRFKYDALSRLTHEKQVEATATLNDLGMAGDPGPDKWTEVLRYNSHGNITDGIDARGVNTHFSYDTLNRVAGITYSDGTPAVSYTYDQARAGFFNKGSLTKVQTVIDPNTTRANMLATSTEFDYDRMGRLKSHRQSIGSQNYNLGYEYNLAGQLTGETYPSGKVVSMNYDAGGRLENVADTTRTYLSGLQYQKNGGMPSAMTLGNGIQESFDYNERLQAKQIAWTKDSQVVQRYDYTYGQIDLQSNTLKNNGKLAQTASYAGGSVSVPTKQFTQQFDYDSIGRLKSETELRGDNNQQSYKQTFSYDNFGNRYLKAAENSAAQNPLFPTSVEAGQIDKATNRFSPSTGTVYDNAGNITTDTKYRNLKYYYDANGRMYKTSGVDDSNQATSVYDAGGQRVATQVNGSWKFTIYDASGKIVAEYGGLQPTGGGGVKYVLQDIQGSTRAITSNNGTVQARMDYQAFGEQIQSNIGQRTAQGYASSDDLKQKYALTVRDEATGLDHTGFRKHENRAGRWTSPDPYNGSMSIGNPQSFNRYSYVGNQPTNFVDPEGLYEGCVHEGMTKFLGNLAGVSQNLVNRLAGYAGGRGTESADSKKWAATSADNAAERLRSGGGPWSIHFPTEAELRERMSTYSSDVTIGSGQHAAFTLHSIQDGLGAHYGYTGTTGHWGSNFKDFIGVGTSVDRVLGDQKFIRAALATLHTMSGGKMSTLTPSQINQLIDAVLNECAGENFKFDITRPPSTVYFGGGGGGGGWMESGFYPYQYSWRPSSMWIIVIRIEVVTVTVVGEEEEVNDQ